MFDVRGLGSKVQYSKVFETSYSWIDIPMVKVKYKWLSKSTFDYTSCVVFKGMSSSIYSKLKSHNFYLTEFSQALKAVKDCDLLAPNLDSHGFLIYPLVDNSVSDRLIITDAEELKEILLPYKEYRIPLTHSITYDPSSYANILLAGSVGCGKTYTCVSTMCEMALQGYQVSIIDGKDADLAFLGSSFLPSNRVATTGEAALQLLRNYVKSMDIRYSRMKDIRKKQPIGHILVDYKSFGMQPKVLFIDEFASILTQLNSRQAKEAISLLKQLVLKNRQSGTFVCISTQQPNAKILDTDVRDNLMLRLFMGVPRSEVKGMVFGSGVELPNPLSGKGTGFIQFAGNDQVKTFRSPTLPTDPMALFELVKECMKAQ